MLLASLSPVQNTEKGSAEVANNDGDKKTLGSLGLARKASWTFACFTLVPYEAPSSKSYDVLLPSSEV
jgi:hypothetical protein